MENELHIVRGARTLNIRGFNGPDDKPCVIITCINHWEPEDPDFQDPEHDHAAFYLTAEDIDQCIAKLQEGKRFLNGR